MILKADMVGDPPYKKFMFDTDFDELAARREKARAAAAAKAAGEDAAETEPEPEPEAPTFSEEDLARAREDGMAEGKRLGIEEAASAIDKQIADTLNTIVQQAQVLFEAQAEANEDVTHHAVAVAAALVRKLFPTLNQETALDQVRSMLETALSQVSGESEIVVRVPADLAEDLHGRIEAVSALSGFRGNIKVLGDPGLAVGDCRLEWSSGGVKRSARDLARQLDEIVARNLGEAARPGSAVAPDADEADADSETAQPEDRPTDVQATNTDAASEPEPEPEPADPAPVESAATEAAPEIAPSEAIPEDAETAGKQPPEANIAEPEAVLNVDATPEAVPELTAEDIAAGPAPVPSDDIIAEAETESVLPTPPLASDDAGPAPVPSDDLVAEASPEGSVEETNEGSEQAAPEPVRYGGADLELEDDLKD